MISRFPRGPRSWRSTIFTSERNAGPAQAVFRKESSRFQDREGGETSVAPWSVIDAPCIGKSFSSFFLVSSGKVDDPGCSG
jgi:hypothetical protein